MKKLFVCLSAVVLLMATTAKLKAGNGGLQGTTLAVVMTNAATANQIKVYDAGTHALLQTLSTHGKGGAGGNARGVRQYHGTLFAAVNNGSNTVALFKRNGNQLAFDRTVATTSSPVSIDFGSGHMYVAGATSVDSFILYGDNVGFMDGSTGLVLVGGAAPPNGSTAQVGSVDNNTLLVTLKTDPIPGTVDVVALYGGAVASAMPVAVSAPAGTLTPFGFAVYPDGTAVITLAHSSQDGLLRDGAFKTVIAAGQTADCWATRVGKYVFTANTGSKTISRLIGTGNNIFVDNPVAASITTGEGPSDIDADGGILGTISGASFLSLFSYDQFGELTATGSISLGISTANGVAIMPPPNN